MRIISGKYKGKRIVAPKNLPVRPTTDMAREALFNILNNRLYFEDLSLLDLYAGTGIISYEFASRGTPRITCVDKDARCVQYIAKTSKALEMPIKAIKSDVLKYIKVVSTSYSMIFADPPYHFEKDTLAKLISLIFESDVLATEGTLIIEHGKHTDLSDVPNFIEARKYGGTVFSFFER